MAILEELETFTKFRGLEGYHRPRYIKHFTDIVRRINEKLKEKKFNWTLEDEKAFQEVKGKFKKDQILGTFDFEKEVIIHTDASDYAIGAEISQLDEEGKRRPILFFSRRLTPAEERDSTVDKEMLAIVQILKKYPHFLREAKFPITIKMNLYSRQGFKNGDIDSFIN